MSPLLTALLGMMLLPLFVATWRASLVCLAAQGMLMTWISLRAAQPLSLHAWLMLAELIAVRAIGAPLSLYTVMRSHRAPARNDVIPANLLSWTLALALVLLAFEFSRALPVARADQRMLIGVAATGVLLGLLVLATQSDPFSQILGALRVEYAITLFELGREHGHVPIGLQLGQTAVVALTVAFFAVSLRQLGFPADAALERPSQEPPL